MCIIFFGKTENGIFLSFNRDEFLSRPTKKLSKIENTDIYYSLDELTQGTFFALNEKSKNFCFLLNHNGSLKHNIEIIQKRGEIPLKYCKLESNSSEKQFNSLNMQFINEIKNNTYNGYNIIFGNLKFNRIFYYTNNQIYYESDDKLKIQLPYEFELKENKVYGVSNLALFQPNNKVDYGIKLIEDSLIKNSKNKKDFNSLEICIDLYNEVTKVMFDKTRFYNNNNLEKMNEILNNNIFIGNPLIDKELMDIFKSAIYVDNKFKNIYCSYGCRQNYFIYSKNCEINTIDDNHNIDNINNELLFQNNSNDYFIFERFADIEKLDVKKITENNVYNSSTYDIYLGQKICNVVSESIDIYSFDEENFIKNYNIIKL